MATVFGSPNTDPNTEQKTGTESDQEEENVVFSETLFSEPAFVGRIIGKGGKRIKPFQRKIGVSMQYDNETNEWTVSGRSQKNVRYAKRWLIKTISKYKEADEKEEEEKEEQDKETKQMVEAILDDIVSEITK